MTIITPEMFLDPRFREQATFLSRLNPMWTPSPRQAEIGKLLFVDGKRRVFVEAGRKFGKSDVAADICWRLGNQIKGGQGYYFGAYQKAVKEIVWANKRIQNHGPREYIKAIHNNEMRLTWSTDTFLKCEGADKFVGGKGFNPDFVVLDEFADYRPEFWYAFSPNFASKDCIVVIISSPPWKLENGPDDPVLFVRLADQWKTLMLEGREKGEKNPYAYVHGTIYDNPKISREWIEGERQTLIQMGMEDLWEREYLAKRVSGGGKRVIGTFQREKHVVPHAELLEMMSKQFDDINFLSIADPSQSSFGNLLMGINCYTKEVFVIDEILETQDDETMAQSLWPRINEQIIDCVGKGNIEEFDLVHDEAAKWWEIDLMNEFGVSSQGTDKNVHDKDQGLALCRAAFFYDKTWVSDRCKNFAHQLENWRRDSKGSIPKKGDDLIDCFRYGLWHIGYFLGEEDKPKAELVHLRHKRRAVRMYEEMERDDIDDLRGFFGGSGYD